MSTYKMNCDCPPPSNLNQTILACGKGTGVVLPDHSESNSQLFNPYVVASVAIDTRTLIHPTVKIDFSSLVTFKEADCYLNDLRLTFQLSKICESGGKVALGTWNYERFINSCCRVYDENAEAASSFNNGHFIKVETVDSFGFTFCECQDCPGCCHYVVEIINAETNNVDHAAVSNCTITALVVGPWVNCDD